jgi:ABC-2 type transport system permease protein
MIRLIRIELLKLRTTRLGYGLLAAGAGLSVLFSVIESSMAGSGGSNAPGPLYTASGFGAVLSGGIWGLLFALVLGVTISTGEYRHKTATLTYLASPNRTRVLLAKIAAASVAGVLFGLLSYLVAGGSALGFTLARGYRVPVSDATMARFGVGHLIAGALLAAIGVGVGELVRSQLAGIVAVFVWTIVIESLLGGLFTSVRPYLPYTAATNLAGTSLGSAAFGPAHGVAGGTPLPFAAATALLVAVAAAFAAVAARTTVPRDIT